ncbi:hypothetical protein Q4512_06415 [Oceanihabitans sp. 2_MG-2023]|uniref:hypothetical protein n=1 Tax=Oceanihabitans sp. 2_MG-2023 TaxID=3062661 RepID=UPI0026E1F6E8|nr:hypothetical protein [Oceanihabitans sp. 2_MG-2023]MDO6596540.1 hypothetical protein [Oceanihabitans sp. 2_MG-2023]
MIKKLVLVPLACILLFGFKSANDISSEKILKDFWLLNKVSYVEPDMHERITLFNDVTNFCFEQSLWRFSELNNTGTYAINDLYCSFGKRNISFDVTKSIKKSGLYDVVLKIQKENGLADKFKVKITEITDNSMQWNYTTWINKRPYTIKMNFVKK